MMKILVLHQKGYERDTFFPRHIKKQLGEIGEVYWNESNLPYTEDTLLEVISDKDICLAGWSVPVFSNSSEEQKFFGQKMTNDYPNCTKYGIIKYIDNSK